MNLQLLIPCSLIILFGLSSMGCQGQKPENVRLTELKEQIVAKHYPKIDAILVAKNDQLLVEEYFNDWEEIHPHDMRSSFKSITSILAGIAIDQGLFSVTDEIEGYITEWRDDPRGKITIKDLLEMKSGLQCENFHGMGRDCESDLWETDDWLNYILNIPLRHTPGLNWEYSSMEPHLVGIIIARSSGMSLMEFAKNNLFDPLGIKNYEWFITPQGRGYAAGSFNMRPRDMLKIAQLVLDKGKWKEDQIVSEEWIIESTNCEIDVMMSFLFWSGMKDAKFASAKYGYFWYREVIQYKDIQTEVLFASGNGGQYMMVFEDYNVAMAFTGSNFGSSRGKLPFEIILKYLIPIIEETN